ncbi:NmrA family NAD(P)-binding protein [Rhodohalobacter sp.]|uniref:NmrA family NAD(P)-binding protein n=1 Tax=Rhodohalobacter sp. TaxID=1974210 RepID=UPI002ACDAEC7|nr:NmrA family NAD(P)-binding protein [Rhodohalobacter sp.]MDZ7757757.1 NmrA family NAD(P)-binding protein [Rhodohalobacter sp.]
MPKKFLITGATGNVGVEVIRYLMNPDHDHTIIAGVRNIEKAKEKFRNFSDLEYVSFDFEDPATFNDALQNVDSVFLLRPPHISDVETYFRPLIEKIKEKSVREILFLSVQGAEKSGVIPHNKIESLISEYNIDHIFLRPSYFMQNLTTTLLPDIREKGCIILPAGRAAFNWIDVKNIGEAAAIMLTRFSELKNQAYELTGYENANFYEVAELINRAIPGTVEYKNVNPVRFFWLKWREGMPPGKIVVMIALHFLPRFQQEPEMSDIYETLTGKKPASLAEFIEREKDEFEFSDV